MTPCLSQATTMSLSFAEDIAAYGDARVGAVEVWLTKLEMHLEANSAADTKALVEGRGLKLVAASYQGGVLVSQGEARKLHFEHFRRPPGDLPGVRHWCYERDRRFRGHARRGDAGAGRRVT